MLYKVVLKFNCLDEAPLCDQANESYWDVVNSAGPAGSARSADPAGYAAHEINKVFSRGISETSCGKIYDVIKHVNTASVKFNCLIGKNSQQSYYGVF